ncbi:chemotaxis protein CheX [Brevibacillus choshinensis]|uniref:Chemotaxis protein CheX n=1 Tax=Brevibacillus choshinensis TaxID=54911 RepID=A0ABX7FU74_BRECH|nr:chemotaxis protein CheX [Brevibacillus choshinensis]QRG69305.1 chemotaxis protein CheX [Brevibacillus choshinensis]
MKDHDFLDPFLESASSVIQQVCNVGISRGEMAEKDWVYTENHTWIRIGMTGQLQGTVFFGLQEELALRIVSAMMGGFPIQEMDEMGKSAISELGNMISGNASTILSSRGVTVDITPPLFLLQQEMQKITGTALSAPLDLHDMGRMEIQMVVVE